MYLPSLYNPSVEEVGVITDTSGSRTDEEINQDLGEISAMLIDANVDNVHFMQADTEVTSEETFTRESLPLKVTVEGRGGTCFGPAIAEMAEKHPNISCLIYLTDLESNDFGDQPHFPVVWYLITTRRHLMVKLSKQLKNYIKEYGVSILVGSVIMFGLLAVASSFHTFLVLLGVLLFTATALFAIWRIMDYD